MRVKVEMEFNVNEVNVAYEYGLEIIDVEDVVREMAYEVAAGYLDSMNFLRPVLMQGA